MEILNTVYQLFISPSIGMLFDILLGGAMVGIVIIACKYCENMKEYFLSKKELYKRLELLHDELLFYTKENERLSNLLIQKHKHDILDEISSDTRYQQEKDRADYFLAREREMRELYEKIRNEYYMYASLKQRDAKQSVLISNRYLNYPMHYKFLISLDDDSSQAINSFDLDITIKYLSSREGKIISLSQALEIIAKERAEYKELHEERMQSSLTSSIIRQRFENENKKHTE